MKLFKMRQLLQRKYKYFFHNSPRECFLHPDLRNVPEKLVMVMMVRDEEEVIEENIRFHLAQGVDFIIVTNNGSKDNTRKKLEKFQDKKYIEIIDDFSVDYSQVAITTNMVKRAKETYNADWVMIADADEFFLSLSGNFKFDLSHYASFNLLYIPMFNIYPENEEDADRIFYDNVKGYYVQSSDFDSGYWSKTIIRVKDFIKPYLGNHDMNMCNKNSCTSKAITLFHYPLRSFSQYERKIKNLSSASNNTDAGMSTYGKEQLDLLPDIYANWKSNLLCNRKFKSEFFTDTRCKDFIENGYKSHFSVLMNNEYEK